MNIKEIIQILRTATLNSITKKSLSESCLCQFEGICDAVEALKELDKPNIAALPQRTWVGLSEDDKVLIDHDANFNQFMTAGEYADRVQQLTEARLKEKNT